MLPFYDISHSDGGPERPCPGPGLGVGMDPLRPALSPESSLASPMLENALSIYDSLAVCCACPGPPPPLRPHEPQSVKDKGRGVSA